MTRSSLSTPLRPAPRWGYLPRVDLRRREVALDALVSDDSLTDRAAAMAEQMHLTAEV
ncbi:MAG TPA: hypothetical protein VGK93_05250 [Candidatus Eisenbacteria bacterium]